MLNESFELTSWRHYDCVPHKYVLLAVAHELRAAQGKE